MQRSTAPPGLRPVRIGHSGGAFGSLSGWPARLGWPGDQRHPAASSGSLAAWWATPRIRLVLRFAMLVGIGLGIETVVLAPDDDPLADVHAYYDAGARLNAGQPLYVQPASIDDAAFYRYPPLLAILFRPLALLPFGLAAAIWMTLIALMFVATLVRLDLRRPLTLFVVCALALPIGWSIVIGQAQVAVTLLLALGIPWAFGPCGHAYEAGCDLTEGLGYPSLPTEDPARAEFYHLIRRKAFRASGVPEMQGPDPAIGGYGVSRGGPQKEDTGGDASFAPHEGLPLGLGPAGSRGGAGARGVCAPALPDRGRFDRHPDRSRRQRLEDLQQRQPLAVTETHETMNERAPLPRTRLAGPSRRLSGARRLARSERGTAVVEFALIAPLLFLIVFGIIEFGRILNDYNQLTQLAGQGARAAAVNRNPDGTAIAAATGTVDDVDCGGKSLLDPVPTLEVLREERLPQQREGLHPQLDPRLGRAAGDCARPVPLQLHTGLFGFAHIT